MAKQEVDLTGLRKKIVEEADAWVHKYVYKRLNQEAEVSKLSPEKFLQEKRFRELTRNQSDSASGSQEIASKNAFDISSSILNDIIEKYPKLVILGDPGMGKSVCLMSITSDYAIDPEKPLPVYIELTNYTAPDENDKSKKENVLKKHIKLFLGIDLEELKEQPFIFLLDGFNEISSNDQEGLIKDITDLMLDYLDSRWIITSRKTPYPTGLGGWTTSEILPLEDTSVRGYIKNLLGEKQVNVLWEWIDNQHMVSIARVPLFLNFICKLYKQDIPIPGSKGGLLNAIVTHEYLSEEKIKKASHHIDSSRRNEIGSDCLDIASKLAYGIYNKTGRIGFDKDLVEEFLPERFRDITGQIIAFFSNTRLIKEQVDDELRSIYAFWHPAFFDFFVGYYIQRKLREAKSEDKLLQEALPYFEFYKWDEPMKIMLGFCSKDLAGELFSLALEQDIFLALYYFPPVSDRLTGAIKTDLNKNISDLLKLMDGAKNNWLLINFIEAIDETCSDFFARHLIQIFKEEKIDKDIKLFALSILARIDGDGFVSVLKELAENQRINVEMVSDVTVILQSVNNPQAITFLLEYVKDYKIHPELRFYTIYELGKICDSQAMPALIRIAEDVEIDSWSRFNAIKILGNIGNYQAIPAIIRFASDSGINIERRCSAILALEKINTPKAIPDLLRIVRDENNDIELRCGAMGALGNVGDSQIVPLLLGFVENYDNDTRFRSSVVRALGNIGSSRAIPLLVKIAEDGDTDV